MSKSGEECFYMLDELGTGMYLTGTGGVLYNAKGRRKIKCGKIQQ